MKTFNLWAAIFLVALIVVINGLAHLGADSNAIIFGVIGLGVVLGMIAVFWMTRPRRRPLSESPGTREALRSPGATGPR